MIYPNKLKPQISIGAMDQTVTLKIRGVETLNVLGEVTSITTNDVDMWAYVMYNDQDERELLNKQTVVEMPIFIIRYHAVSVDDQVVHDGKTYDILMVEDLGRRRFCKLKCKLVE